MGGGKVSSAAGMICLVGDGGGRDIIFIRDDSTVLQGRAMSQARNWSQTKWNGDCSLYRAQGDRNGRHIKKERRCETELFGSMGISWPPEASAGTGILSVWGCFSDMVYPDNPSGVLFFA
jgi:hypothetical protein